MNTQTARQQQPGQAFSGGGPRRGPSSSIRKMAVLFTDIVGSSGYFKKYGDISGREMLRRHQKMASGPVNAYGGAVVKVLGDSVMAYFTDPEEALKAAVTIQERFIRNNKSRDPRDHINLRIGLHYGEGIVDRGDIYGDVVNITAKFLPLVKGGEILISDQLRKKVSGLPWAGFERLNLDTKKEILKSLVVFRVIRDKTARLEPAVSTVVVLKPIWNLAGKSFRQAWDLLLRQRVMLWSGAPGRWAELEDGSVILYVEDPSDSAGMGLSALDFLRKNSRNQGAPFMPVQVLIDRGRFRKAGEPDPSGLKEGLQHAKPGEITVSAAAFESIRVPGGLEVIAPEEGGGPAYYRLVSESGSKEDDTCLFLFQHSLTNGNHGPCFYCGDGRHLAADCPSKQLPDVTSGIEQLGYHSIERINELFYEYLNPPGGQMAAGPLRNPAAQAFFELKQVFQLRFLRTLWASGADKWNEVKAGGQEGEKGGLIWIGQDCIRVSNLEQAESVLLEALEHYPNDYLALCAAGFLMIERGDRSRARRFFKQALEKAHSAPREIFARLLLARLHELSGEHRQSEDQVRRVLLTDSFCQEAQYLDIKSRFRKGTSGDALRRLMRLVESNRRYFIAALIDPELAAYSTRIHPEINRVLNKASDQAGLLASRAAEGMEKMRRLLGVEEDEFKNAASYYEKVKELSTTQSYFGFLDIIYYSTVIIRIARRSGERTRRDLINAHGALEDRLRACNRFAANYPYRSLLGSFTQDLSTLRRQLDDIKEVIRNQTLEKDGQSIKLLNELSKSMAGMEHKTSRLAGLMRWMRFGSNFGKKAFLMEGAVVLIALVLFPAMGHYLHFLIPGTALSPENIWIYQKAILMLGGGGAVVAALFMSAGDLWDA
jgi:class 3 adenylate cyclase/tetratricopeptide (TPR) repeat protein